MSEINCNVISDLLPLYVENMLSKDSRLLVEEHIQKCTKCQKKLGDIQADVPIPLDNDVQTLRKIKRRIYSQKALAIVITALTVVTIMVLGAVHITAPIPLEFDESLIHISQTEEGAIMVTLGEEVDGYNVFGYSTIDNKFDYNITIWTSLWNRYFGRSKEQSFIINKSSLGEYTDVRNIYFYSSHDNTQRSKGDIVIYGEENKHGGDENSESITLPRLVLSYYFFIAIMCIIICILVRIFLKKGNIGCKGIDMITLIPVSYVISQVLVKGFSFSTHTLRKDLTGIILVMIFVYGVFYFVYQLYHTRKRMQ